MLRVTRLFLLCFRTFVLAWLDLFAALIGIATLGFYMPNFGFGWVCFVDLNFTIPIDRKIREKE